MKRKNDNINFEQFRGVFLGIGFLVISAFTLTAFKYKSYFLDSYEIKLSIDGVQDRIPPLIAPPAPPEVNFPAPPKPDVAETTVESVALKLVDSEVQQKLEESAEIDLSDLQDQFLGTEGPVDLVPLPEGPASVRVSEMPYFLECEHLQTNEERDFCTREKINQFLGRNMQIPDVAVDMGYEGKMYVEFVVGLDGVIKNLKVLKSIHGSIDNEAFRTLNKLPKLVPGKNMGEPKEVMYKIPIQIILSE